MTATLDLKGLLEPREACGFPFAQAPHPKQRAFLLLTKEREVFTGGAGGGGKSSALLMAATQFVCVPGYSALLMRRTYKQLTGDDGLIERSHQWFGGTGAQWRATDLSWEFPSGATISFGHAESDDDRTKFSGHAFQFVGFDELTMWPSPKMYLYVGFARVRRPKAAAALGACPSCGLTLAEVPLRTRASANPGDRGHVWVRQRFGIQLAGGTPDGRRFIPSRVEDNPSLDRETYAAGLAELDAVERARMLMGDWEINEAGRMFKRAWFTD